MLRLLPSHLFTAGLFAVLAGPALALQSTQFGGQNIVTSGATAVADLSPADLDNDGDVDVAAALTGADRVVWYRQNATGTFTQRVLDSSMPNVTSVHTADLDGDGDMDIVAGAPGAFFPPPEMATRSASTATTGAETSAPSASRSRSRASGT